jgi:hypothetical protein
MQKQTPQGLHARRSAARKQLGALLAVFWWVLWAHDFISGSDIDVGTYRRLNVFPTFHACQEQAKLFERIAGEGIGLYCLPRDEA